MHVLQDVNDRHVPPPTSMPSAPEPSAMSTSDRPCSRSAQSRQCPAAIFGFALTFTASLISWILVVLLHPLYSCEVISALQLSSHSRSLVPPPRVGESTKYL